MTGPYEPACREKRRDFSWVRKAVFGEVFFVLDRLGRSTRDVLNLVHELEQKGAGLRVLEPEFCTSTDTGRILVTVLGMVAEMERRFILERQRAASMPPKERASTKGESPRCLSRLCA